MCRTGGSGSWDASIEGWQHLKNLQMNDNVAVQEIKYYAYGGETERGEEEKWRKSRAPAGL